MLTVLVSSMDRPLLIVVEIVYLILIPIATQTVLLTLIQEMKTQPSPTSSPILALAIPFFVRIVKNVMVQHSATSPDRTATFDVTTQLVKMESVIDTLENVFVSVLENKDFLKVRTVISVPPLLLL